MVAAEEREQPPPRPVRRALVIRGGFLRADRGDLQEAYGKGDLDALTRLLATLPGAVGEAGKDGRPPFAVTHLPLRDWTLRLERDAETAKALAEDTTPEEDVALGLAFATQRDATRLSDALRRLYGSSERPGAPGIDAPEGDIPLTPALHWCHGRGEGNDFGTEADAHALIRAGAIGGSAYDGTDVKVVVIDQGVDADRLPPGTAFMGGWWKPGLPLPGKAAKDNRHGTMIARNVLALAPRAMIFDCPLIPPRIRGNLPSFLSDAFGAITRMRLDILRLGRLHRRWRGRWIFVNAWAIYDPRGEAVPGEYTRNRYHWLACAFDTVTPFVDVVFAAGNCGQFCPDRRCAESVIGPGRGILGVHLLDEVLTVAGVRTDGIWTGFSSQGPGRWLNYHEPQLKPDVAAPTQFRVLGTAHRLAGGSSAAAGVAAGVVAALRTRWDTAGLPPAALFDRLRQTARQPDGGTAWSDRTGHGILDCPAVVASLEAAPGA